MTNFEGVDVAFARDAIEAADQALSGTGLAGSVADVQTVADVQSVAGAKLRIEAMQSYFAAADANKNGVLERNELEAIAKNADLVVTPEQQNSAQFLLSKFDDLRTLAPKGRSPFSQDLNDIKRTYIFDSLYDIEDSDEGVSALDLRAALLALHNERETNEAVTQLRSNLKWGGAFQAVGGAAAFLGSAACWSVPEPTTATKIVGTLLFGFGYTGLNRSFQSFSGSDADVLDKAIRRNRTTISAWNLVS